MALSASLPPLPIFSFALAQAFAETLAIRLDIDMDIGWIMTEVAPLAESAIAMLLKVETRLLCTAILMIS